MPSQSKLKDLALSISIASGALLPCLAWATLGEPVSSVQTDGVQLQGSVQRIGSRKLSRA